MEIFNVLSDYNRLRIVVLLIDREMCNAHIYLGLKLKQANTSKHLKLLKDMNIINIRNVKANRYYSLSDSFINAYPEILAYLKRLSLDDNFKEDVYNLKAVKTCSCINQCECRI